MSNPSHPVRWKYVFRMVGISVLVFLVASQLLSPAVVSGNPGHDAGEYFMYAKAAGDGDTDHPKAYEPVCDDSNDKQAKASGSNSSFHGPIHSNADLATSGSDNWFRNTGSPNPALTYGVNDGTSAC